MSEEKEDFACAAKKEKISPARRCPVPRTSSPQRSRHGGRVCSVKIKRKQLKSAFFKIKQTNTDNQMILARKIKSATFFSDVRYVEEFSEQSVKFPHKFSHVSAWIGAKSAKCLWFCFENCFLNTKFVTKTCWIVEVGEGFPGYCVSCPEDACPKQFMVFLLDSQGARRRLAQGVFRASTPRRLGWVEDHLFLACDNNPLAAIWLWIWEECF